MLVPALKKFSPWFDADDNGGGGGQQEPPANPPATPPAKNADGGGQQPGSQEDEDKKYAERARRAAESERKKLWDALGVTTQDEFDAYVKAKKAAEDKNKSELEKAAGDLKDTTTKLTKTQSENEALQKRLADSEIKFVAREALKDKDGKVTRAAFRPDAMDEVLLMIDRSEIKEEDGKYSGIDKALEKLAKAKPHWLAEAVDPKSQAKGSPLPKGNGKPVQPGANEDRATIISSL